MKHKEALALLPSEPTQAKVNPARLKYLIIADPKWGKTTFFMSNPNALLLQFEEGSAFIRGHKISIDKWDAKDYAVYKDEEGVRHMTFMQAIDVLETAKDKFDMVVIDTADMAAKMCIDYWCGKKNVEHPQDAGDYGKGWEVTINTPFRKAMMRLLKTGRGIAFITHSKTEIMKFTSGEKARKECTLSKGPKSLIFGQADVVMHGEIGQKQPGQRLRDRILVTEMDADTMAGNRTGTMLPARYVVDKKDSWAQFKKFFTDPTAADKADKAYKLAMKGSK